MLATQLFTKLLPPLGSKCAPLDPRWQKMKAIAFGAVEFLIARNLLLREYECMGAASIREHTFLQHFEMMVARQPLVPKGLQALNLGRIAGIRTVVHVKPRQLVESD